MARTAITGDSAVRALFLFGQSLEENIVLHDCSPKKANPHIR